MQDYNKKGLIRMLNKKEILLLLDKLALQNNVDSYLTMPFIYIENELRKSLLEQLKKENDWSFETESFFYDFVERCRIITKDSNYKGFKRELFAVANTSFLNDTFFAIFRKVKISNLRNYFKKNREHAYFVLMSVHNFPFLEFDEIFKEIILTAKKESLKIDFYQSLPLFLNAFYNGYGFEALKKIKKSSLLNVFNSYRSMKNLVPAIASSNYLEILPYNSSIEWLNTIMLSQPYGDREDFPISDNVQILFILRDSEDKFAKIPFSKDGEYANGDFVFVFNQDFENLTVNDLDQLKRIKHLVHVLSLNSNIDYYFSKQKTDGDFLQLRVSKDKANAEINKKAFYSRFRELEKEENSIFYKLKRLNRPTLNRYKNFSNPTYEKFCEQLDQKFEEGLLLEYKFNYTALVINNDFNIAILENIPDFIKNNTEYYDEEKGALSEEGVEIFTLNYLY